MNELIQLLTFRSTYFRFPGRWLTRNLLFYNGVSLNELLLLFLLLFTYCYGILVSMRE